MPKFLSRVLLRLFPAAPGPLCLLPTVAIDLPLNARWADRHAREAAA